MRSPTGQRLVSRAWWRSVLFCQLVFCFTVTPAAISLAAQKTDALRAEQLTEHAIESGLAGDLQRRRELLRTAVRLAPDFAPARWESGEICVDDEWESVRAAQALAAADPRLVRYREFRSNVSDGPDGHLQLARWCRRNQLSDEARYHWLHVLNAEAQNEEALSALDSVWHGGRLISNDAAQRLRKQERAQRRANRTWKVRIAKWERALSQGPAEAEAALDDLRRTVDVTAIQEFERLASQREKVTAPTAERRFRLSLAFIKALGDMSQHAATESLVRHAVLAPDKFLRTRATESLAERPVDECMPLLLAGLASPIESNFNLSMSPLGSVSYSHEFFAQGRRAQEVFERSQSAHFRPVVSRRLVLEDEHTQYRVIAGAIFASQQLTREKLHQFQQEADRVEQTVVIENQRRTLINQRILNVLRMVVGEDFGDEPLDWWTYWQQYNEYEQPEYGLTDYRREALCAQHTVFAYPSSCFVAGTPVWTKTGLIPIESIVAGDLVLTKDLPTGELSYRPVLETTERSPSPTLTIVADEQRIRTTLGHPFWLPAVGWRMAKELSPGDRLLAIDDPVEIKEISPADDEVAFNLVVDGHGNYFVGENGLLVHDNTPRQPGAALANVPSP